MAGRRSDKERLRQERVAREQREARARRRERRIYIGLGAGLLVLAVVAVVIVSSRKSVAPALTPVAPSTQAVGQPASPVGRSAGTVLTANVRQANQILGSTIQAKVAQLRGVPVVINQWASWCSNCRAEFPYFQTAGRQDAGRVAFVGLDSQDQRSTAQAFLRQFPVDYPSVFDPSASQAQSLGGGQGWPTTIYMNARHQITYVHEGAYPSLQALQQDISRYA